MWLKMLLYNLNIFILMAIVDSHGNTNIIFPKNPSNNETGFNRTVQSPNQLTTVKSPQPHQTVQHPQSQVAQHFKLQTDQPLQPQTVQNPQPQPNITTIKHIEPSVFSQSTGQRMQSTTNKLPKNSTTLPFEPSSTPVDESINKNEVNYILLLSILIC